MADIFGFIGTGNMGGALAGAVAKSVPAEQILLSNRTAEKAEKLAEELGCSAVDAITAAQRSRYLFLGVKPQMMGGLLAELSDILADRRDRFVLISMAAGLTIADIRDMAGGNYPVIRMMPNTPVSVGEGIILYDFDGLKEQEHQTFCEALSAAGMLDRLPEDLMDAGTAVAGCGPAFTDLFLEALADGGVAGGLPAEKALAYAGQMVKGAAALMLESGLHPAVLKDAVCSPGGATLAGVRALEEQDLHQLVMEAVEAALRRTKELRAQ